MVYIKGLDKVVELLCPPNTRRCALAQEARKGDEHGHHALRQRRAGVQRHAIVQLRRRALRVAVAAQRDHERGVVLPADRVMRFQEVVWCAHEGVYIAFAAQHAHGILGQAFPSPGCPGGLLS
jgi:hypothetical protein